MITVMCTACYSFAISYIDLYFFLALFSLLLSPFPSFHPFHSSFLLFYFLLCFFHSSFFRGDSFSLDPLFCSLFSLSFVLSSFLPFFTPISYFNFFVSFIYSSIHPFLLLIVFWNFTWLFYSFIRLIYSFIRLFIYSVLLIVYWNFTWPFYFWKKELKKNY
jgi:hypothetical protein